ncbi:peptidoglycan-binding protein [Streptomyces spiroverticillatus]|uniref:Peptidoglycan-binding protein n=1 Tax=Streptomyces finlayi TaxID=67296 RepID=A0A918X223_9ACTN|nr:peptidoglycan-binding protein [Streptomyces finlayi]GHA23137.1 peptidoglycan-binding protein [Streptomyces spiroverticillatus]GHD04728.1 peptidoglycan-binding protein [Streptomyces finlayi]
MTRKSLGFALAFLLVAGGGTAAVTVLGDREADAAGQEESAGLPPATASVERGSLSTSSQTHGTIGYDGERKINASASASASGVLTSLPATGSTISRDGILYQVNGSPVRLLYGKEPMYRDLKQGDKGRDVRQLKANLQAMGYGAALTVDEKFTPGTTEAVKRWQRKHGVRQTGRVGAGDIAFAPGALRVKSAAAGLGDPLAPGGHVLTTTGSDRIVTIKLDVAKAGGVKEGARVTVELPGGGTAEGRIRSVGTTVDPPKDPQGQEPDAKPKITVTVAFDDPDKAKGLDQAPVTVRIVGETKKSVLTVPVNALLALPDGGFGVQVVENGKVRQVKVTLGLFGGGRVEVTGGDLTEGAKVGVPRI